MAPRNWKSTDDCRSLANDGFAILDVLVSLTVLSISVASITWYVQNLSMQKRESDEKFALAMYISTGRDLPKVGETLTSQGIDFMVEKATLLEDAEAVALLVRSKVSKRQYGFLRPTPE